MAVGAAPHLPAGILSPQAGRGELAATLPLFLLPVHGKKVPEGRMRGGANVEAFGPSALRRPYSPSSAGTATPAISAAVSLAAPARAMRSVSALRAGAGSRCSGASRSISAP